MSLQAFVVATQEVTFQMDAAKVQKYLPYVQGDYGCVQTVLGHITIEALRNSIFELDGTERTLSDEAFYHRMKAFTIIAQ